MDSQALLKQTMKTVGIMLASWGAFMGVLTLIVFVATGRPSSSDDGPALVPASKIDGQRPPDPPKATPKKQDLPPGASRAT